MDEEGDDEEGVSEDEGEKVDWQELDVVLSKLAKVSVSLRGKRLTFVLMVFGWHMNKELMPTLRKWLPALLPAFSELGLLHVHYVRDGRCWAVDDSSSCHDKPDCLTWGRTLETGPR